MPEEIKILLAALEFYSDPKNYEECHWMDISSKVEIDKGKKAKAALEAYKDFGTASDLGSI